MREIPLPHQLIASPRPAVEGAGFFNICGNIIYAPKVEGRLLPFLRCNGGREPLQPRSSAESPHSCTSYFLFERERHVFMYTCRQRHRQSVSLCVSEYDWARVGVQGCSRGKPTFCLGTHGIGLRTSPRQDKMRQIWWSLTQHDLVCRVDVMGTMCQLACA